MVISWPARIKDKGGLRSQFCSVIDIAPTLLEAVGVPCSPINTIPEVFDEPQVKHRGMLRELPHPTAGRVPQVVSPLNFANAALSFDRAPPLLGEHTEAILRELGLPTSR